MLTEVQEKVLKFLHTNGSPTRGVAIKIDDVNPAYIMQAIEELEKLGFVQNCSTLSSPVAILRERGLTYFSDMEKVKYGNYYNEIKLIEKNIEQIEKLEDDDIGHDKFAEILEIHNDIKGLKTGITNYRADDEFIASFSKPISFDSNKIVAIERLKKYKDSLLQKNQKDKTSQIKNVFKPTNNVNITNTVEISINQVMHNVLNLPDKEVSSDEKILLQKMLYELEELKGKKKEKKKFGEKLKSLGNWIFDKGIAVASAVLPYIVQLLKSIQN